MSGDERDRRIRAVRRHAARQVLDDLALEAVVIVRVCRTARNFGRIAMAMNIGVLVGGQRSASVGREIDEPRHRSDRRPHERQQHIGVQRETLCGRECHKVAMVLELTDIVDIWGL